MDLCDVCNKFGFVINGNNKITQSMLFSYMYEKIAHQNNKNEEELLKLLIGIGMKKSSDMIDLDIESIKNVITELYAKKDIQ